MIFSLHLKVLGNYEYIRMNIQISLAKVSSKSLKRSKID